jgi:predicted small secreted protein
VLKILCATCAAIVVVSTVSIINAQTKKEERSVPVVQQQYVTKKGFNKDFSYAVASMMVFQVTCNDRTLIQPSIKAIAMQHYNDHSSEVEAAKAYIANELVLWEREHPNNVRALEMWCPMMKDWIRDFQTSN